MRKMNARATLLLGIFFTTSCVSYYPDDCQPLDKESVVASDREREIVGEITAQLVEIPAGSFIMGCEGIPRFEEVHGPSFLVFISRPFQMSRFELTRSQWEGIMSTRPWQGKPDSLSGEKLREDGPNYPVNYVSWQDAHCLIQRINAISGKKFRLPTEAEWEYACRAGSQTKWSFGDDRNDLENYAVLGEQHPFINYPHAQVGSKLPNAFGLFDMYGNVGELCEDFWDPNDQRHSTNSQIDPLKNSLPMKSRVLSDTYVIEKGFKGYPSCSRGFRSIDQRSHDVGFRLVMEMK